MRVNVSLALVLTALGAGCGQHSKSSDPPAPPPEAYLDPPAPGKGWQWHPAEFDVAAGTDQQNCYFYQIPGSGTDPVYVNHFLASQNVGTHHLNVFRVKTIVDLDPANGLVQTSTSGNGPCFKSSNWADWPLVFNSQEAGNLEWQLPDGVAHKFTPGEWIMVQSHYVNATTQMTPSKGLVYVNFYTTDASTVTHELGTLFATKQSIRVCQHDDHPKFSGTCQFNSPQPVQIIGANGHFHSRGKEFQMFAWDGTSQVNPPMSERFYLSDVWNEPPMLRSPDLDKVIPANGGIWYTCEFQWQPPPPPMTCDGLNQKDKTQLGTPDDALDCCYTFGGPVDWAEHCNNFVYYYPKQDNVFCY